MKSSIVRLLGNEQGSSVQELTHIHPDAEVHPTAKIGPFTVVHAGVRVEEGAVIGSHCELGIPTPLAHSDTLTIPKGALIRSHSVFYIGSTFGPGLSTGHRVTVRENTKAGGSLQIGTLSDLQGDIVLGEHVRIHSSVFIAKGAKIGDFVWLVPHVVLTKAPHPPRDLTIGVTVEDYAAVAAMSVVLPGVKVGRKSLVAAGSVVTKDVAENSFVRGAPAVEQGPASHIKLRDGSDRPAYPWTEHFHRGYPREIVEQWKLSANLRADES
jgi:acetyltransferase-like isoleucine patch superfamily enzyme